MGKINGEIALITGASRGIALEFSSEGAHIAFNYGPAYWRTGLQAY
ncbi:MAG: hypothetical protein ABSA52_23555 [Candidatus Binatia bacterium]|jgi:short-subunit dehydrogenase